jgi:hypothetical protein
MGDRISSGMNSGRPHRELKLRHSQKFLPVERKAIQWSGMTTKKKPASGPPATAKKPTAAGKASATTVQKPGVTKTVHQLRKKYG